MSSRMHMPGLLASCVPGDLPAKVEGWVRRDTRDVTYATSAGLIREDSRGLRLLSPHEAPVVEAAVLGHRCLLDASSLEEGEAMYRLPEVHARLVVDSHAFSPRPMGPVRIIFESVAGHVVGVYFSVQKGTSQATIEDDVRLLLSGLKLCVSYST